jgi:hypothetical protein
LSEFLAALAREYTPNIFSSSFLVSALSVLNFFLFLYKK